MRGMLSLLWIITLIALVAFFVLLIIFVIDKVKQRDSSVSGRVLITTLVMSLILLVTSCGADVGSETARGLSSNVAKSDNLAITSDDDSTTSQDSEIDVDVEPDDNIHTITEVSPNISNNEPIAYHTDITYEQVAHAPADFAGEKMQFSGKVVKIVPTDGDDKVRLAVNDNPNNLLIVDVDQDLLNGSNLLEGQQVTFSGVIEGIETYQTDQGDKVTAPSMDAKIINYQASN
ncbi:hypothetical protein [Leuconostoc lactis]|uniref:hypothetical protein n=1 Tax=Leuconostoc lactis TaxID=1246 RepID=UPI0011BB34B4|nr:hypothetical protein [Leuconostoc lactis]QEA50326.1 hypothetical protein FGL78_01045 [Leuconostoc lactis]